MPDDALDRVLRLVAEGRLTAAEAAPILDALDSRPGSTAAGSAVPDDRPADQADDTPGKVLRVQVTEKGRAVINLRIPLSLGRAAIGQVPGLSESTSDRIREAIEAGVKGSILDVDDDGDGVRISIE
jgi:SHOCT-like protein